MQDKNQKKRWKSEFLYILNVERSRLKVNGQRQVNNKALHGAYEAPCPIAIPLSDYTLSR